MNVNAVQTRSVKKRIVDRRGVLLVQILVHRAHGGQAVQTPDQVIAGHQAARTLAATTTGNNSAGGRNNDLPHS